MKCPECNNALFWVGDELFDEITHKRFETVWACNKCDIDVIKKQYIYDNKKR